VKFTRNQYRRMHAICCLQVKLLYNEVKFAQVNLRSEICNHITTFLAEIGPT